MLASGKRMKRRWSNYNGRNGLLAGNRSTGTGTRLLGGKGGRFGAEHAQLWDDVTALRFRVVKMLFLEDGERRRVLVCFDDECQIESKKHGAGTAPAIRSSSTELTVCGSRTEEHPEDQLGLPEPRNRPKCANLSRPGGTVQQLSESRVRRSAPPRFPSPSPRGSAKAEAC